MTNVRDGAHRKGLDRQAMQQTAPPGYATNWEAFIDLIRFGPEIWGPMGSLVLNFHAERTVLWGKASDRHAQSQAIGGVYNLKTGEMVRGCAGVSRATYNAENAALLIDDTQPNQPSPRPRVLRKIRHRSDRKGNEYTEFQIDWLAFRAAISEWKESHLRADLPLLQGGSTSTPLVHHTDKGLSSRRTPLVHHTDKGLSSRRTHSSDSDSVDRTVSESRVREVVPPIAADTHPLSLEEEARKTSSAEILNVIEAAYGRPLRPNDPIPGQILDIGRRLGVSTRALCFFLQETAATWRSRNYHVTSPKLFLKATGEDLIPWRNANLSLIDSCEREERDAARRATYAAPLAELPAAPVQPEVLLCPECHQEALIDGTCQSEECVTEREQQRANRRASSGG